MWTCGSVAVHERVCMWVSGFLAVCAAHGVPSPLLVPAGAAAATDAAAHYRGVLVIYYVCLCSRGDDVCFTFKPCSSLVLPENHCYCCTDCNTHLVHCMYIIISKC